MYKVFVPSVVCIAAFSIGSLSAQSLSDQDKKFIEKAAKGNMEEVQMGKMGVEKASAQPVKTLAQRLVDDHTKASTDLQQLAAKKGVTLPAATSKDMADSSLAKKSGAKFDKAYAKAMEKDHKEDIAEFEKEVKKGSDPEVKQWAKDMLPALQGHLLQAEALQ